MMMKSKANLKTSRKGGGFSAIELIITATILTIVTGFGLLGINRAKASIRLSGAAREYASYIEKARVLSIRSHADDADERSTIAINEDKTSYDITMDLDNDGDLDTRTITLPDGIEFDGDPESIAFDWRGRTWNTENEPNAQISIRLKNDIEIVSIDVTGSGDVTINSAVFDDEVPNVTLKVGDLASNGTPTTTTTTPTTTTTTPGQTTPPVTVDPLPDTQPDPVDTTSDPDPTTNPDPSTSPSPTPTPSPSPSPSPSTQQPPTVCTINTDMAILTLNLLGSGTIKVSHNASVSLAITATSSKSSDLQVSGGQTVAPGDTASFTVKSKKLLGNYNVTFKTSCGEKVVSVKVLGPLTLGL